MLTPATYGFGTRLSVAAHYWLGINGTGVKFPGVVGFNVEGGAQAGFGFTSGGANLQNSKVFVYSSPGSNAPSTRFTTQRFPNFVGMWGKSKAVFPTNLTTWQVWGPPANAT